MIRTEGGEIAEALSDGEKLALRIAPETGYFDWPESARDAHSFCRAGRSLMKQRLIEWHPDPRKTLTRLTAQGRSARAALKANPPEGDAT